MFVLAWFRGRWKYAEEKKSSDNSQEDRTVSRLAVPPWLTFYKTSEIPRTLAAPKLSDGEYLAQDIDSFTCWKILNERCNPEIRPHDLGFDTGGEDQTLEICATQKNLPVCFHCTRNKFPDLFLFTSLIQTKQNINLRDSSWSFSLLRRSRFSCSGCRLISQAVGDLLDAEDGQVVGRVEHFATDCMNLSESGRLWLFIPSDEESGISSAIAPSQGKEVTQKVSICCVQSVRKAKLKPHSLFSGRSVSSSSTNFDLLKHWLSLCERSHLTSCGVRDILDSPSPSLRVLDVVKGCVVTAPPDCRYLALSYVWGDFKQLQLNSKTQSFLTKEGSIFDDSWLNYSNEERSTRKGDRAKIPNTIKDAISLCQNLGERYLWVSVTFLLFVNAAESLEPS
jgi:hypothetical protein